MLHEPVVSQDAERARSDFLALINPNHRSHITNLFLEPARAGLRKPSEVLSRVLSTVKRKLAEATDEDERGKWQAIRATLATPQALDFAAYAIHYTDIPGDERQRIKATRAAVHIDGYMATQPPTTSQLNLLSRLGWTGTPTVENRAEASVLIAALLGQGGRRGY